MLDEELLSNNFPILPTKTKVIMSEQSEQGKLIGQHPENSDLFSEWLICEDLPAISNKKHRKLSEIGAQRPNAIEQLANWIITHHLTKRRLERLKKKKEILGTLISRELRGVLLFENYI